MTISHNFYLKYLRFYIRLPVLKYNLKYAVYIKAVHNLVLEIA